MEKILEECADRLDIMAENLPGCTIDFYSNSSELLELREIAQKLRELCLKGE